MREIVKQTDRIELWAFERDPQFVVVAVHIFALALVSAQGVPGRKSLVNGNLKHYFPLGRDHRKLLAWFLHEPFDCGDVPGGRVRRKRFHENFTILHALDAVVENGQDAAIGARTDEPPKALLERQNRLGHLVLREGIAAVLLQCFYTRRYYRVGGHGERQLVHNHTGKLVAAYVHALPETRRGEEHRAYSRAE